MQKAFRITRTCIFIVCFVGYCILIDLDMETPSPTLKGLLRFFNDQKAPFKRLELGSWDQWVKAQSIFTVDSHSGTLKAVDVCIFQVQ